MSDLGAKILSLAPGQVSRLAYGVMASTTTVSIEGATTAVTVPQLTSAGVLVSGDFVAIQMVGADALIIGSVQRSELFVLDSNVLGILDSGVLA